MSSLLLFIYMCILFFGYNEFHANLFVQLYLQENNIIGIWNIFNKNQKGIHCVLQKPVYTPYTEDPLIFFYNVIYFTFFFHFLIRKSKIFPFFVKSVLWREKTWKLTESDFFWKQNWTFAEIIRSLSPILFPYYPNMPYFLLFSMEWLL